MKRIHISILMFFVLAFAEVASAQDSALAQLKTENVKKIFIRDLQDLEVAGNYSTIYEIIPTAGAFQIFRLKQSFKLEGTEQLKNFDLVQSDKRTRIKDISTDQIKNLISAMQEPAGEVKVQQFINENWQKKTLPTFAANASIDDKNLTAAEVERCKTLIEQQKIGSADLVKFFYSQWTMDHPEISVYFITDTDTLGLISKNLQPYMLPWKINGKVLSYNKEISTALEVILPDLYYSNNERLAGKHFEEDFAYYLVDEFCTKPIEKQRIKGAYNAHFTALESKFRIDDFEYGNKSDIEIDDEFLEFKIYPRDLPSNYFFAPKFSKEENVITPVQPFLDRYSEYINSLKKVNWLQQWINEKKGTVEIAFANDRSFTQRAENFFTNDTKTFIQQNNLQEKLSQAVLIKVTEGKGKFSRWIILPDGRVILWHYKGSGTLNFKDQQLGITAGSGLKVVGKFVNEQGLVR